MIENNWNNSVLIDITDMLRLLFRLYYLYLLLLWSGAYALFQFKQTMTQLKHDYTNYLSLYQQNVVSHLISDYNTHVSAEIIDLIEWHNQNKRGSPSENDTSYFRHYYMYYFCIMFMMSIIHIISTELFLLSVHGSYLHQLPKCGWVVHLGYHVPEEMTMKFLQCLACPVKDTDLLLLRSAHRVPREDCVLP
jgi:hypothetical protein